MNDEDFAHQAFATAFASGASKEPMTLPDAEVLAFRGRRAARNRRGIYAAGTTALVGVVTAGVAGGPSLLNLGAGPGSTVGTAAGGGSSVSAVPSKSPSQSPDLAKPSGSPCASPPTIDWTAIVTAALPAGIHAAPDHNVNCLNFPEGSRSIEAGFTLSVPTGVLQIDVESGGSLATKLNQTERPRPGDSKPAPPAASGSGSADSSSTSPSVDPTTLASLEAAKRSMAADSSAQASLDALKQSMAATDEAAARAAKASAAASAGANGSDSIGKTPPTCHPLAANITACASTVTKGGFVATDVQIIRTGANAVVIDVVAAAGTDATSPAPGTKAPLNEAQVTAIAQAVLAHF